MLFPGEEEAVAQVLKCADIYGYGNLIAHLKREWAEMLMREGLPQATALRGADASAYPLRKDRCKRDHS